MTGSRAGATQDGVVQEEGQVRCAVINHVAVFTLDWPKALNALSHGMVTQIAARLEACRSDDGIYAIAFTGAGPKAFCAGGDVRGIYAMARAGDTAWLDFFIDEYRLDYELHHFPKPVLALMDRITIGGGMGIGQAASVRIVTERTRIAMPETRIGLVPDVGATHFLSGMPAQAELYVGLTGVMLGSGDALALGLADACVSPAWADDFTAWLAALDWRGGDLDIAAAVTAQSVDPGPATHSAVAARLGEIGRHFAPGHSVEQMIASLERGLADDAGRTNAASSDSGNADSSSGTVLPAAAADWRRDALEALQHCSPTMLKVTREALLRGRQMTLAECFRSELAIVRRTIGQGDFVEGVRALLIDKDRAPQWRPPALAAVRDEDVDAYLASPWSAAGHPLADLGERTR